jgi:hypothetical protein
MDNLSWNCGFRIERPQHLRHERTVQCRPQRTFLTRGSWPNAMNIDDHHCDIVCLPLLGSVTRPCEHFF